MSSHEFLKEYLDGLEEETFVHARSSKVLFSLIEELRKNIEGDSLKDEKEAFLNTMNLFEEVLDSVILTSD